MGHPETATKKNYWVYQLTCSTLLYIWFFRKQVEHLTYVLYTPAAGWWIALFTRLGFFSFPIIKVKYRRGAAGPIVHMHRIRDDRGRVLTMDVNRQVLDLRREILSQFLPRWQHMTFLKKYTSLTMVRAYFGVSIALHLNGPVILANVARWKYYEPTATYPIPNILILPPSPWSHILKTHFEKIVDQVKVQKQWLPEWNLLFPLLKHLARAAVGCLWPTRTPHTIQQTNTGNPTSPSTPSRMMISYAMGTIEGNRNDINFYFAVKDKMPASRLLFYFRYQNLYPSPGELEWFKTNQIPCFAGPSFDKQIDGIPLWQASPQFKHHLREFYRLFLETARQSFFSQRTGHPLWLLDRLWDMGWNVAQWKDFFLTNQIRLMVHSVPGDWNFIPSLALAEVGGISATMERSILFDYCTYFHNAPGHLNFVTGPYSLTQIPEPSFSFFTLQVGGINVGNPPEIPWITEQRKRNRVVITVFDELPNDWYFGDSVRHMYEALIELVNTDEPQRFALVIKTKKPEVLEQMPDVFHQITQLAERNVCLIADWKVTPAAAAAHSHLVLCVPSTATFESVMIGAPTIVFNPMKAGLSLFYTHQGLNRRIFEDRASLLAAIRRFADENDTTVGDCSDLKKQIDPYGDGLAAERVGQYLHACLESFDRGLSAAEILQQCNQTFTQQWGEDKLTAEFAYENH